MLLHIEINNWLRGGKDIVNIWAAASDETMATTYRAPCTRLHVYIQVEDGEDGLQIAADILNKEMRTFDKRRSFFLRGGRSAASHTL